MHEATPCDLNLETVLHAHSYSGDGPSPRRCRDRQLSLAWIFECGSAAPAGGLPPDSAD